MRRLIRLVVPVALGAVVGCAAGDGVEPARQAEAPSHAQPASAPARTPAAPSTSLQESATPGGAPASPASAPVAEIPPLRKGTVVLHVGDSFVHSGLTQRLREHFEPLGVRYEVRAEHSTNSMDWAKRVPGEVAMSKPDLVIITLGGNEIGSQHLDVQARAIERIVKSIGDRPCVWTTPPLWMEESGLFDTLQEHVAPCRFFETDRVVGTFIPRRGDKIHPTMEGGAMWADKLFGYLMAERTGDADAPWHLKPAPSDERTPRGRRGPLPKG